MKRKQTQKLIDKQIFSWQNHFMVYHFTVSYILIRLLYFVFCSTYEKVYQNLTTTFFPNIKSKYITSVLWFSLNTIYFIYVVYSKLCSVKEVIVSQWKNATACEYNCGFSFILSLSGYSYFVASSKGRKDALTSI